SGGAVVGETSAATNENTSADFSFSNALGSPTCEGKPLTSGEKADAELLDEHKMIRVSKNGTIFGLISIDVEDDPEMKHRLLRFARKLKEVDEDVQWHNELLEVVKGAPSEINEVVARRRKDFTSEFFVHLHTVIESYYDNPTEQNALAKIGNMCLAAVQSHDTASENIEALNAAVLKFQDILNSPSLDAACWKIDNLAAKNQLDSALVLMITKAWSAAKESNMIKEEVKDILYHLYMTARGNLQRLMPKEIQIIKYLLTIKDPEEQLSALKDAFTPGENFKGRT
ncbi:hypothetical protein RJ641_019921, partial [Dillenia turbinata]